MLEFVKGYSERGRIEHLLAAMRESGLRFFRNRAKHDGARAAAHLRRKWNAVRDRIKTAEQFIEHIATRSSMTGRPYQVRLADGRAVEMRVWLTEQLDALDAPRQG